MTEEAVNAPNLSLLPWLEEALGHDLLVYVLNVESGKLQDLESSRIACSGAQAGLLIILDRFLNSIPVEIADSERRELIRSWLTQLEANGISRARYFHLHAGGRSPDLPDTSSAVESAIASVAADAYPAFLIPVESDALWHRRFYNIHVTRAIFKHPQHKLFQGAVIRDSVFKKAFVDSGPGGPTASIIRNTGQASGLQLIAFADRLLQSTWRHLLKSEATPEALAEKSIEGYRAIRSILSGESHEAIAQMAFLVYCCRRVILA